MQRHFAMTTLLLSLSPVCALAQDGIEPVFLAPEQISEICALTQDPQVCINTLNLAMDAMRVPINTVSTDVRRQKAVRPGDFSMLPSASLSDGFLPDPGAIARKIQREVIAMDQGSGFSGKPIQATDGPRFLKPKVRD